MTGYTPSPVATAACNDPSKYKQLYNTTTPTPSQIASCERGIDVSKTFPYLLPLLDDQLDTYLPQVQGYLNGLSPGTVALGAPKDSGNNLPLMGSQSGLTGTEFDALIQYFSNTEASVTVKDVILSCDDVVTSYCPLVPTKKGLAVAASYRASVTYNFWFDSSLGPAVTIYNNTTGENVGTFETAAGSTSGIDGEFSVLLGLYNFLFSLSLNTFELNQSLLKRLYDWQKTD